jgi:hypothetical protein
VIAAFFNFAPHMVARALPAVWRLATPQEALRARLTGGVQALAELTYELPESHLAEAAELLTAAAATLEPAGRVLGAANAALPAGEYPLARLGRPPPLREHRGRARRGAGRRRAGPGGDARLPVRRPACRRRS